MAADPRACATVADLICRYNHPTTISSTSAWDTRFEAEWYQGCLELADQLDDDKRVTNQKTELLRLLAEARALSDRENNRDATARVLRGIQRSLAPVAIVPGRPESALEADVPCGEPSPLATALRDEIASLRAEVEQLRFLMETNKKTSLARKRSLPSRGRKKAGRGKPQT